MTLVNCPRCQREKGEWESLTKHHVSQNECELCKGTGEVDKPTAHKYLDYVLRTELKVIGIDDQLIDDSIGMVRNSLDEFKTLFNINGK